MRVAEHMEAAQDKGFAPEKALKSMRMHTA